MESKHLDAELIRRLADDPRVLFIEEVSPVGRTPLPQAPTVPFNLDAQLTHNVPDLRKLYNVTGGGIEVGVWDEGPVLGTHVEFGNRVQVRDPGLQDYHATHVAGTIGAQGIEKTAEGMAPGVTVISYNWNDSINKMQAALHETPGVHIANHSYGQLRGWSYSQDLGSWCWNGNPTISETEDYLFGKYTSLSNSIDDLVFSHRDLTIFVAAGNQRSRANNPNIIPGWNGSYRLASQDYEPSTVRRPSNYQHAGYDTLEGYGVAKNVITIGAMEDAPLGVDKVSPDIVRVTMFSSFGKPDDGRVKPDLVANGAQLYSPSVQRLPGGSYNRHFYERRSGTSMASPAAAGIAALMMELGLKRRGRVLSADEMKAVLVHTAVSPEPGPTYKIGWGAIDALAAGRLVAGDSGTLVLDSVGAGKPVALRATSGGVPIRITLAWIDPPAKPNAGGLDDRTPSLVNDLDLIVTDQDHKRYFPWSLDPKEPDAPATRTAVNTVDNVEPVDIGSDANDTRQWTIEIRAPEGHQAKQPFAVAISGLKLAPTSEAE
ncbi:S8 family serine peptidase [Bradyrhizobium sp. CB82]|uniref:S8 family serine peptidase n=1 Tax=Bradyrhizobium sp. CB82 TaxID=3039159 RepID=UPI0024B22F39|nr:S8 family serine peptidase [Bradyrhizobium sp. CB82]WFU41809.1 S8 family serine peptidase [Bradyrhizobium sp. CB82]